jgi:2-oxoglutarate dehydrogenase complex dehydrogenase (E1) component-like enzyme
MLRRQIHRKFRKPLVLMTPKSLLRYTPSFSTLDQFTQGAAQLVIDDAHVQDRDKIRRVLLCSGKVYYTLHAAREKAPDKTAETAIVRVEQLYPFPQKEVQAVLARYGRKQEVCWVQDEPKNRGAWSFIEPRLLSVLPDNVVLVYHGRDEAASPATGSAKMHQLEEQELVAHALELAPRQKEVKQATQPGTPATARSTTAVSD